MLEYVQMTFTRFRNKYSAQGSYIRQRERLIQVKEAGIKDFNAVRMHIFVVRP